MKTADIHEFHRPRQIEEALHLLARSDVSTAPIGGGSDLIAHGRADVEAVVDLSELGLSYVRREGDALRVGATTTLQELIDAPDSARAWDGELARVVELTAARNLREQGTLAGTLVAAQANNPLAVLLLALDASVTIEPGHTTVAPDAFFPQRQSLLTASLITEVIIPLPGPGERVAFDTVSRTPADLPIVCAAVRARMESHAKRLARIALGGAGSMPLRAALMEQAIEAGPIDLRDVEAAAADLNPPSDFLGSAEYRRAMIIVLVRRILQQL